MSSTDQQPTPAPRALQLDAHRLNMELESLFLNQARITLQPFRQYHLPEIKLLVRLYLHLTTIFLNKAPAGHLLHNLTPSSHHTTLSNPTPRSLSKIQRISHLLVTILLPYLSTRLQQYFPSRFYSILETALRMSSTFNLLLFLRHGRFCTLGHRVTGMKMVPLHATTLTRSAFEFMDRQLVWDGIAQFVLFVMPVVKGLVQTSWLRAVAAVRRVGTNGGGDKCGGCGGMVVMKHCAMPCLCVYCYVCGCRMKDRVGTRCVTCGGRVERLERSTFA